MAGIWRIKMKQVFTLEWREVLRLLYDELINSGKIPRDLDHGVNVHIIPNESGGPTFVIEVGDVIPGAQSF